MFIFSAAFLSCLKIRHMHNIDPSAVTYIIQAVAAVFIAPFDIEIRNQIGISVEVNEIGTIASVVEKLLKEDAYSKEKMKDMRSKYLYNVSGSADVGASYIINRLVEMSTS